ncbi:MAG: hypothetical protein BWY89_01710 [Bacteroidetes bacterium ADurb.BinA012]|nr:MAG: hypothetical protein BWY89_01710 [Bacteroidetes bacterium ADurb.BinA012]
MKTLDIGNIARDPFIVGRKATLLSKEHCEVELWEWFMVSVVAKANILVQLAIGRDARNVVAEIVILKDTLHP